MITTSRCAEVGCAVATLTHTTLEHFLKLLDKGVSRVVTVQDAHFFAGPELQDDLVRGRERHFCVVANTTGEVPFRNGFTYTKCSRFFRFSYDVRRHREQHLKIDQRSVHERVCRPF